MSDDAAYREQIAYLLERSPFYREKLAGHDPGGLEDIASLPLTDKSEIRATVTPENATVRPAVLIVRTSASSVVAPGRAISSRNRLTTNSA